VFLLPGRYDETPAATLLLEASKGRLPLDHATLRSLFARPEETAAAIVQVSRRMQEWRYDFTDDLLTLARHLNDPRTLPFLIDVLEDEEPPDAVYEVVSALGAPAVEPLLEAIAANHDPHFRSNAAFALAALGIEDERIEKAVRDYDPDGVALELYQDRGEKHVPPFDVYEDYPKQGVPIVELLHVEEQLELLESAREEYRILAAASLYRENLQPAQVRRLFEKAKSESSEQVRAHLWQALEAGLDQDDIAAEMTRRLEDAATSEAEQCGLAVGMAAVADRAPVRAAIERLYANPATRLKALEAMWRSQLPEYAHRFPAHLDDENLEIRRVALRGAGAHGLAPELGRIRKLLTHKDLREDALFAYAMAAPAKDSPAYLRTLYDKIAKEAGGLDAEEDRIVRLALDQRLEAAGRSPVFLAEAKPE
jgi:catechol 2,3-dioxygenase-like lactoylglutathione lyase family enzyme